ncbi:hypothetical protein B0H10DRAFT_2234539 [Mycena sp. CBHHK59/15]|nr:hypothetical protein B0H10DRAFT_2234539 [Mycena sp. CBHHK59/15]
MAVWPLYIIYPTCKRWTNLAPIPLGFMFKIGIFMGWSDLSVDRTIPWNTLIPIYLGACLWTITYETVYQHQVHCANIAKYYLLTPELDSVHKPRSRRCFVCGTTGMHPLEFRVCPRTAVLLCRSLAKINDDGRLFAFDGSALPMTRHPGGVAAHLLTRFRNPARIIPEPPDSPPAPRVSHDPPNSVLTKPRERVQPTQTNI